MTKSERPFSHKQFCYRAHKIRIAYTPHDRLTNDNDKRGWLAESGEELRCNCCWLVWPCWWPSASLCRLLLDGRRPFSHPLYIRQQDGLFIQPSIHLSSQSIELAGSAHRSYSTPIIHTHMLMLRLVFMLMYVGEAQLASRRSRTVYGRHKSKALLYYIKYIDFTFLFSFFLFCCICRWQHATAQTCHTRIYER